ncbi:AzlD domain-containing protein (plasmid) [Photobacterium sp. GJ3]|uniref:AzlD domain-containing protein n=1 Tax=Photobacterium sp. GJ3 TaxID=2829502 RepID=UPI001B8B9D6A|nr:AzlD domain-containing protein [Photobacterium sp. GJ3]QUJ70180.1 AzlD domain-containing protein [Photobacterium sp. GJ3]
MIWLTILAMALIVFASRYLFLAPGLPIRLNHQAQRFLSYASPAVLTAIWAPIVFVPEQSGLNLSWSNPYLIGALVSALIAWKTKNVLLTAVIGMAVFGGVSILM